jgi:hypothetical protein
MVVSVALRDLPFSQNQPQKSAAGLCIGSLKTKQKIRRSLIKFRKPRLGIVI